MINTEKGPVIAPGIESRMAWQQARILDGVVKGQIVKEELEQLRNGAEQFKQKIADFKGDDGKLDLTERVDLHKSLNKGSLGIYVLKHNGEIEPQ